MANGPELKSLEGSVLSSFQVRVVEFHNFITVHAHHVVMVFVIQGWFVKRNPTMTLKGFREQTRIAKGGNGSIYCGRTDFGMA
jgi:hypothetical protein